MPCADCNNIFGMKAARSPYCHPCENFRMLKMWASADFLKVKGTVEKKDHQPSLAVEELGKMRKRVAELQQALGVEEELTQYQKEFRGIE